MIRELMQCIIFFLIENARLKYLLILLQERFYSKIKLLPQQRKFLNY
jgi:hypothetical protein